MSNVKTYCIKGFINVAKFFLKNATLTYWEKNQTSRSGFDEKSVTENRADKPKQSVRAKGSLVGSLMIQHLLK